MKKIFLLILIIINSYCDVFSFGAISTEDRKITEVSLTPLINYISKELDADISFESGFDYSDTIEHFIDAKYDFGFIGPSPLVIANQNMKQKLKIIAALNNKNDGTFHSVIVVKKGSDIKSLKDLVGKSFAYGSPKSTLSFFMPAYLLKKEGLDAKLSNTVFLGKHDKVAKYVIMGKYDAGGIKTSVAKKYSKYLDVIAKTEDVPDFVIVASPNISDKIVQKIQKALLKPEAIKIAQSIKPSATGFRIREKSDYEKLKEFMIFVDPNSLTIQR